MALIIGPDGIYKTNIDGTMEPISPDSASLNVNGRHIYQFSKETGILTMSTTEGELEDILNSIGDIPEKGIRLTLDVPFVGCVTFDGVKEVKRYESEESLFQEEVKRVTEPAKPNLLTRIKGYIAGKMYNFGTR